MFEEATKCISSQAYFVDVSSTLVTDGEASKGAMGASTGGGKKLVRRRKGKRRKENKCCVISEMIASSLEMSL